MARLYTYGSLNRINNVPGKNALPGTYTSAQGIQFAQGAMKTTSDAIEFGEVVELVSENAKGLGVKRATSSITADTAVIVVRDLVGVRTIQAGVAETVGDGVPFSVVKANSAHNWDIVVPLVAGVTPAVGGAVYVGKGSNGTVLGGIYATAQGSGGADSIALTGWTFKSLKFTPTSSAGICAVIGK